jgi:hypothetical protein
MNSTPSASKLWLRDEIRKCDFEEEKLLRKLAECRARRSTLVETCEVFEQRFPETLVEKPL